MLDEEGREALQATLTLRHYGCWLLIFGGFPARLKLPVAIGFGVKEVGSADRFGFVCGWIGASYIVSNRIEGPFKGCIKIYIRTL